MINNQITKYEEIDYYWIKIKDIYSSYPTVRHRHRFVINAIKKFIKKNDFSFFDYGTGNGDLLSKVQNSFNLDENKLGGCEISNVGFDLTKEKLKTNSLYNSSLPKLNIKFDVISCVEVIEHTKDYIEIIKWIENHLNDGGVFILSTQSGPIYNSDEYVGHTQHFEINNLKYILEQNGFEIKYARQWGFPFFTIQKNLTNFNFKFTKDYFLETNSSFIKDFFYNFICLIYHLHDFINLGPQIYIVAKKL